MSDQNRRDWLKVAGAGAIIGAAAIASKDLMVDTASAEEPAQGKLDKPNFSYCLNTATIRGQKLTLAEEIDVAAKAGYDGIEIWVGKLNDHLKAGGTTADIKKQLDDVGLKVESAIAFANWISDDDDVRRKGLEDAKRDMDLLREIGGTRIAAPPAGATKERMSDLFAIGQRYRALLELGAAAEVIPQLEVWGFSQTLKHFAEAAMVATAAAHKDACILPDVYHLYKGGSAVESLRMISGNAMHVFHMNDYPADPPRETINDAARVFTGDGVADIDLTLQILAVNGFAGVLSLELFNPEYYKRDALAVAQEGLEKMKASVEKAFA